MKVVVTRSGHRGKRFAEALQEKGVEALWLPVSETIFLNHRLPAPLHEYGWVVLTSRNGAQALHQVVEEKVRDATGLKFAVQGSGTAERVVELFGCEPEFVGSGPTSVEFCRELNAKVGGGERVLVVRPAQTHTHVADSLGDAGHLVDEAVLYKTAPHTYDASDLASLVAAFYENESKANIGVVFFSPSAVVHFAELSVVAQERVIAIPFGLATADAATGEGYHTVMPGSKMPSVDTFLGEVVNFVGKPRDK